VFDTKEQAAAAYDNEARVQRGESAVCNFGKQEGAEILAAARAAVRKKEAERAAKLAAVAAAAQEVQKQEAERAAELAAKAAAEWSFF
jgi:hypothetical protein